MTSSSPSPRSSTELLAANSALDTDEFPLSTVAQSSELEEWGVARNASTPSGEQPDEHWANIQRSLTALLSKIPGLSDAVERVAEFVRGPVPPIVLQGPTSWTLRQATFENEFVRHTRFLTSPILFLALVPVYILVVSALSRAQSHSIPPEQELECTSTFWPAPYDRCGLDGESCAPHSNASFSFRCPSECTTVYLHNPRVIGAEEIAYKPLIVGGGDEQRTYRGDSWICAAALQEGIISDYWGGCVTVDLIGTFTDYLPRSANGLLSIGFPSSFPLAFRLASNTALSRCTDLRSLALVFNAFTTFLLSAILRPRPIILYWSLVGIGFWHVTLFSQPRSAPPDLEFGISTFLPALFVCHALWLSAVKHVLPSLVKRIPVEGTVLYLAPWWITVLNNMTLDRLPVDRLMLSDINKRAGGLATLFVGILVVIVILANQIMIMRKTGYLVKYLQWYGAGLAVIVALALVPGFNLRIHHYIFAIMFIPGTAFPTRLSAIFQGFLLGMFLNGVAAWGFDGILQTATGLRRDAPMGTTLPSFLPFDLATGLVRWNRIPYNEVWDGFRLLVDDVERYTGSAHNYSVQALQEGVPHFFRLAFTKAGERTGDWTMPVTLWPNGTWIEPLPGSSY